MNKVSICNYRKSLKINLKQKVNELGSNKINDREMFMKGIDYSYYYEEADDTVQTAGGNVQ